MIYYYSISDFPATVFLFASTFLSTLPPSSSDYLCLPASLFCVHHSTFFIHIIVSAKLFLFAYFITHFVSSALLHDFLSTDLVISLMFVDPCIIVKFINKNPTRCNSVSKFIIPYLCEAQHVSGDTPPIIRSLKLH